jgi:hypothetical protein
MREFLFMLVGAVVLGVLARWGKQKNTQHGAPRRVQSSQGDAGSAALYWVFVLMLAFSPVVGIAFSMLLPALGREENVFGVFMLYSAIGMAASLPLSLGLARAFGMTRYLDYWRYLEMTMSRGKKQILLQWAGLVVMAVLVGAAFVIRG